jgi:hypothetical protein
MMVKFALPLRWLVAVGLMMLIGLGGSVCAGARAGPAPVSAETGGHSTAREAERDDTHEETPMAVEVNKAVVLRWFQAFNDRDMTEDEAVRASDFVAHIAGVAGPLDGAGWQ